MARSLCVLVDQGPYGSLRAAEAIRHALGAAGKGWDVVLALTGDAVLTALPGQSPPAGEWICLADALGQLVGLEATVLVEERALETRGIGAGDLIAGLRAASVQDVAAALARCERTLLF
jgi:sulfur relay (sulfurtransferase) complex TusBCD TusD component (DsrE family)